MSELKPCPFCGEKAYYWHGRESGLWSVGCMNEQCFGYAGSHHKNLKEVVVEAWNTRHERTCELIKHAARDEESGIELVLYECGQCGWIVDPSRNERYCPNCGARVKEAER